VIAWPNYYDVAHFRVPQIDVNTGQLELAAGHLESAALHLRSGLARDPDDASARLMLGRVLELGAARH
jgi:cytochrome c-type biogenesis protein CcmH/NrfG